MADPERQIVESLDATPDLLPYLPELLRDVPVLGANVEVIAGMLAALSLPPATRVVDLACGKGAVALRLADDLGCRVLGIDLFEAFVQDARQAAAGLGLGQRCRFEIADVRDVVADAAHRAAFDVAVYSGVDVLGAPADCVAALRRLVPDGGHIVIDDGFAEGPGAAAVAGGHYVGHAGTLAQLQSHGDTLVGEHILPPAELAAFHRAATAGIRRRAMDLANRMPGRAALFQDYVRRQERESEALERGFVSAVWLLRKEAGRPGG